MDITIENKICQTCKQIKDITLFGKNIRSNDGFHYSCKICANLARTRSKIYRKNNSFDKRFSLKNTDTNNNVRQCSKCKEIKTLDLFPKSKRSHLGRAGTCKACKVLYRDTWIPYFIKKYGEIPQCQVCGITLTWSIKDKRSKAQFDHRHNGNEIIKTSPSTWYQARYCTEEAIKIWESCDFGILCINCNYKIPTKNRKEWLEKITKYING